MFSQEYECVLLQDEEDIHFQGDRSRCGVLDEIESPALENNVFSTNG